MQQLMRRLRGDEGASAVLVAFLMIPILGFTALTIDAGALYWEKSELQNGADAAALGIATRCARSLPTCSATAYGADVTDIANQNDSVDALQHIASVTFPTSNSVQVTTNTQTANGSNTIPHPFLSAMSALIGQPDPAANRVGAVGTASWQAPSSAASTLPLAFSLCGLQAALANGTKVLLRSDNNNGNGNGNGNGNNGSCSAADNHPIAGGFGWLATPNGVCSATLIDGTLAASDQGNDLPANCRSLINPESLNGTIVEVPIFDCAVHGTNVSSCLTQVGNHTGNQSVDNYRIYGFAAFKIAGHRLTGSDSATDPTYNGNLACTGNCRGIQGTFVHWSFDGPTSTNPGPDLGAYSVRLTQ